MSTAPAAQSTERTFLLPDLGEGLTEAEIVSWLVAEGDEVRIDQVVVEVETAKSVVEVPSPFAGTVRTLHAAAGETLAVGRPLITIAPAESSLPDRESSLPDRESSLPDRESSLPDGESSLPDGESSLPDRESSLPDREVDASAVPADAARYREEERAGSGNVLIGYGTSDKGGSGRRRRPRSRTTGAAVREARAGRVVRVISPLVRRLAHEGGLDLQSIEATGFGGIVTRSDVDRALAARAADSSPRASASPSDRPAAAPTSGAPAETAPGERRIPLSGFRRAVSTSLSRSRAEIPEATVWVDVDATALWDLRAATDPGPGLLAYIARFVVAGLKQYPVFNARLDTERDEIVEYDAINLGVAVQGDRGLVVPAVRDAGAMTTAQLDAGIREVTERARVGKVSPEEMASATFTLNNYGGFRVDGSAAIINHPQVAILGFGRIIDRPWVVDGQIVARKITQMSFVFDHRVCDGGTAAGFMRSVADAIEDPASAIPRL